MRWNLDVLYKGFDADYDRDIEKFEGMVAEFIDWSRKNLSSNDNAKEKIEHYLNFSKNLNDCFYKLLMFARLTVSTDARNETAKKYSGMLEDKISETVEPNVKFQKWLAGLGDVAALIKSSPLLEEHRFYLENIIEKNKYMLTEEVEKVIAKMQNNGSNAWGKLHEHINSTLLVDIEIDGEKKKLPLPLVRNMAYEKDAKVRKTGYEAELKSYSQVEDACAACLSSIKGEAVYLSKLRGYDSVLDRSLKSYHMTEKTLNAMMTAVEEILPKFQDYYRKKAEMLGHKNGLPFYETFTPIGEMQMHVPLEKAKKYVVDNFGKFSPRMAEFADNAFNNGWVDTEVRDGKIGGAFCVNLHPVGQSRVLSNYSDNFSGIKVLAHELGHAYHGHCLMEESSLNTHYTSPIAETASIFAETIVKNAALKDADANDRLTLLENSIAYDGYVIVDVYCRFMFEKEIINRREKSGLTAKEFCEIMEDCQKKAYGKGYDPEALHPYMWICKPHYYDADHNFYNYPYTFGLLFAKGLYAEYLKKGSPFADDYDRLLSITGKNTVENIGKIAGLDVQSVDFWRSALSVVKADIDEFLKL